MKNTSEPNDLIEGFEKLKASIEQKHRWRKRRNTFLILLGLAALIFVLNFFY